MSHHFYYLQMKAAHFPAALIPMYQTARSRFSDECNIRFPKRAVSDMLSAMGCQHPKQNPAICNTVPHVC